MHGARALLRSARCGLVLKAASGRLRTRTVGSYIYMVTSAHSLDTYSCRRQLRTLQQARRLARQMRREMEVEAAVAARRRPPPHGGASDTPLVAEVDSWPTDALHAVERAGLTHRAALVERHAVTAQADYSIRYGR